MGQRYIVVVSDYLDGDSDGPYRDSRADDIHISAGELRIMDAGVFDEYMQLLHNGVEARIQSSSGLPVIVGGVDIEFHADRHLGSGADSIYTLADRPPAATDDENDGYDIGSRWIDTADGYEYVCIDDSAGSAVWESTTVGGGGSGSGLTETEHRSLRQLIHFIDEGPALGFASGATKTITPPGDPFPTQVTWRDSLGNKLVEKTLTRNSMQFPTTIQWVMYDTDGATPLETVTDTISYFGPFETGRTRTIA